MRIQPRQQLLEIWRAAAEASLRDGRWQWGGREAPNSIADAEQLLCLLLPATEIPRFRLDQPDETEDDVLAALRRLGSAVEAPRLLVRTIREYLERYRRDDGTPVFAGGAYFDPPRGAASVTPEQSDLDVVESFGASITLTLATLGFIRVFRREVSRPDTLADIDAVEEMSMQRLSAAMVGLLRSFTVNVFDAGHAYGEQLTRTVNQNADPPNVLVAALRRRLRDVAAGLRDLSLGSGTAEDLDDASKLFECGWSWGIIKDAQTVDFVTDIGEQHKGYALDAPYLYFTVVALDAIADLFSERTLRLGLLDEQQQRLARALQIRWELTQQYWAAIAGFGTDRWPLEDIPWRAVDGQESDYFTLMVVSIAARGLAQRKDSDAGLRRLFNVLTELANRERIARRPIPDDPGMLLHSHGLEIRLEGSESTGEDAVRWVATDFAPLLLTRTIRLAALSSDIELRGDVLNLANLIWRHMERRRLVDGHGRDLWDQPAGAFPALEVRYQAPSWHHTVRVVESLVSAAGLSASHPLFSDRLDDIAADLLSEAEHLYDQELLDGAAESGRAMREQLSRVSDTLTRARDIRGDQPGTAVALLLEVLRELDGLAVARQGHGS
jgi:hypothetical protein